MMKLMTFKMGDLEIATLEFLWQVGEADAKRVHADLGVKRAITLNTIQSTLDRLYRKELLVRRKVSHCFLYAAAVDRTEMVGNAVLGVAGQFGASNPRAILNAFVDFAARTDVTILAELEQLVAEHLGALPKT